MVESAMAIAFGPSYLLKMTFLAVCQLVVLFKVIINLLNARFQTYTVPPAHGVDHRNIH